MKGCILAIDAGGTYLKAALFEGGAMIDGTLDKEAVDSEWWTLDEIKAAYLALIGRQRESAERSGYSIERVAVDTPGPFDYATGTPMMTHKYKVLYGTSIKPWIAEASGTENIRFIHDSEAFIRGAASEHPEYRRIAGVMLGTGLGFALMTDGEPLRNPAGGPAVSIYNKPYRAGTAEDYISGRGIVRRYNTLSPDEAANGKVIGDLADSGDPLAVDVYSETGKMLGEVIRPVLDEYKIEALVVGGQLAKSFPAMEAALKKELHGIKTLRCVTAAHDIDNIHLYGVADIK